MLGRTAHSLSLYLLLVRPGRIALLFTRVMPLPISCSTLSGETDLLSSPLISMFQLSHHEFTAVSPRYNLQRTGHLSKDGTLRNSCRCFSWRRKFVFYQDYNFLMARKGTITLMRLVKISDSDSLYSRPERHIMFKAFSISKNISAVDTLLLKCWVT
jgi:hypothetical protein